ncbi:hypothetical protein [Caproiciproducens galactitolivorans]|uniref:hypothetical protein n=1 Tax=Caproiciproducens galactitolivorans TaxID=642589 RepID=UPI00240A60E6|nr:hypothetical protein [Caproiciproducens galactitolivorans]
MITILPLKDRERTERILRSVPGAEDDARVLVMWEGADERGYIVVDMKASTIRLLKMEISGCKDFSQADGDSRMCADSLMRAAASFGSTIGAYQMESKIAGWEPFFQSAGFVLQNGSMLCPLSKFVKICNYSE